MNETLYVVTTDYKRPEGRSVNRPSKVTADGMYDTVKIRNYNRKRGIKSNIPVNTRNRKKKKIWDELNI
ncbi:putative IS1648 transposase [Methanosarcina siciliae T4/M]|uniref:Putative IS1648 transposase n=2 Tax=Methanosarcina siciliae TaxID=38027 RepID=A0A0E3LAN4_9EURY|nr:hypothetical protein [Methanosarcina siciliae]AKB28327.1 putative IS1648 transposase [Methanosarcina siciliae T4/M]AKB32326.1 putative IS1648 transposase [Methanosarcina siciliae HI350]